MKNPDKYLKMGQLLFAALNGDASGEQINQLRMQLAGDPSAMEYYIELLTIHASLRQPYSVSLSSLKENIEGSTKEDIWKELAEYEKNGIPVEVERVNRPVEKVLTEEQRQAKIRAFFTEERAMEEQERRLEQEARRRIRERNLQRRRRKQMARMLVAKVRQYVRNAAIAAMLILVGYLLYAVMHPAPPAFVATLTDGIDIKWADSGKPIQLDSLLRPGLMKLVEGYAQITFDDGARIILEAPAEINIENSNRAFLQLGKLSAEVPIQSRGFKIDTPSASIVDLGTEFGVKVDMGGNTDIHMFKGKASLLGGRKGQAGKGRLITAGNAIRVKTSGLMDTIAFKTDAFIRKINSKSNTVWRGKNINLADIVGGGDGFGTAQDNLALHPLTGNFVFIRVGTGSEIPEEFYMTGPFIEVPQSKWIDGVFVPDGGEGPVQIAGNGLFFDGFGDTSGNMFAYLQNQKKSFNIDGNDNPNTANKACIPMHSNLGITFDLERIRERFDGQVEIKAFRAGSGFRSVLNYSKVDFWVLVDGRARYKRLGTYTTPELDEVEISIYPDARYLTLAVTESDDGMANDWTMFVSPMLILE